MRIRRSLLVLTSVWALVLATSSVWADIVELSDGTRIETSSVTFGEHAVQLADGRTIPRDQVRKIVLEGAQTSELGRAPLMAGADVQDLLQKAAAAREKYPDVGAITLIDAGDFTLRPDGTQVQRNHAATLILKEPWKAAGQIGQAYEDGRERVTLIRARTIAPDGTVYEFDPADLKESKPTGDMVSFAEYKTVTGQLPQVEIGSIVETIWETETYNPYDKKLFFPRWYFGSTEPSLDSRVTVRVPKGQPLYYEPKHLDAAATPKEWDEDEYHVYQWELADIPHVVDEPAMPPVGEVVPSVAASLFKDWNYIYDFLGKFQKEHMEVTPEITAQVAEIVGDSKEPEEKIAKIYDWLQREVRYISIKGSMGSGWSGHPATLTLKNKYGDCIDKATLFATMLKAVDIQAEPVVLATFGLPEDDRTLPTMYGNHAITEVHLNGRDFHLDCTGTSFRYPYFAMMDHGVTTINVLQRKIGRIEVPPAKDNALLLDVKLRLEDNGDLKAVFKVKCNGSIEGFGRSGLEEINKVFLKMVAQQAINSLSPGAELRSIDTTDEADLTKPLEITLKILFPNYPTHAGDLLIFELPFAKALQGMAALTALDQRDFDILMPSAMGMQQHVQLELPAGYAPKGLPADVDLSTPYTHYQARYQFQDGKIVFESSLSLDRRRIPAADYAQLKQFMDQLTDSIKLPLFLSQARS